MKEINLDYLIQNYDGRIASACDFIKNQYPPYPNKPSKPFLPQKHNSTDLLIYYDKLKAYEIQLEQYQILKENYNNDVNYLNGELEKFIKDQAGLNTIPDKYQANVYNKAYQMGHSCGYSEVYHYLCSLIEIFEV